MSYWHARHALHPIMASRRLRTSRLVMAVTGLSFQFLNCFAGNAPSHLLDGAWSRFVFFAVSGKGFRKSSRTFAKQLADLSTISSRAGKVGTSCGSRPSPAAAMIAFARSSPFSDRGLGLRGPRLPCIDRSCKRRFFH